MDQNLKPVPPNPNPPNQNITGGDPAQPVQPLTQPTQPIQDAMNTQQSPMSNTNGGQVISDQNNLQPAQPVGVDIEQNTSISNQPIVQPSSGVVDNNQVNPTPEVINSNNAGQSIAQSNLDNNELQQSLSSNPVVDSSVSTPMNNVNNDMLQQSQPVNPTSEPVTPVQSQPETVQANPMQQADMNNMTTEQSASPVTPATLNLNEQVNNNNISDNLPNLGSNMTTPDLNQNGADIQPSMQPTMNDNSPKIQINPNQNQDSNTTTVDNSVLDQTGSFKNSNLPPINNPNKPEMATSQKIKNTSKMLILVFVLLLIIIVAIVAYIFVFSGDNSDNANVNNIEVSDQEIVSSAYDDSLQLIETIEDDIESIQIETDFEDFDQELEFGL